MEKLGLPHADEYVDESLACFTLRRKLLDEYPDILAPRQVYGIG